MRRLVIVILLTICVTLPVTAESTAERQTESSALDINAPDDYVIHRGETIEAYLSVRNLGDETTTIYFAAILPNNISITELPEEFTLLPDQIRQFRFYFSCDDSAPFENQTVTIEITSSLDETETYSNDLNILIARYSDLTFGVTDDSEFIVDPGIRTNLAVNMTNNGLFTDDVTFSLATNSAWNWGWTMDNVEDGKAKQSFSSGDLKFIRLWIDTPVVIDSNPLFMTGPRFTLTATSSLDFAETTWSFDLLMSEFRNVTLVDYGDDLSVDPDSSDRLPVTVSNSGNIENTVSIELYVINPNGEIVLDIPLADRIEYDGWIIAIFGGYEEELLFPGDSRTFEIGFQSPSDNFGEVNIRLKITPNGASSRAVSVDLAAQINWQRGFTNEVLSQNCSLLPGESCVPEVRLFNDGNYQDTFKIEAINVPEFVEVNTDQIIREIPQGMYIDINNFNITADMEVDAFVNGFVILQVSMVGAAEPVENLTIEIVIAPIIDWSLQDLVSEEDAFGRHNIAMTLRNDGNAADGIIVQLQCSHYTPMTLIPPTGAIVEEGVELPRSFEISDIGYGANFTVRAWAEIPTNQPSNGTMFVNITIRSGFAPDEAIEFSSSVDYLGVSWQPESSNNVEQNFSQTISEFFAILFAWKWVIISGVIATLFISKAFRDRKARIENAALLGGMLNSASSENHDWMQKFQRNEAKTLPLESPKISAERFTAGFRSKSAGAKPITKPVDEKLRNAATLILDVHDKSSVVDEADKLLDSINTEGISSPAKENSMLETQEFTAAMTRRRDPQNLIPIVKNTTQHTKSVPLPDDDDDLDL